MEFIVGTEDGVYEVGSRRRHDLHGSAVTSLARTRDGVIWVTDPAVDLVA